MTRALPIQTWKELRELLPWWGAVVVTIAALGQIAQMDAIPPFSSERALMLGLFAYIAGSVALGALSVGHEYSHRALPMLLALPVSRARVLAIKLGVLAVLLAALGAVANWQFRTDLYVWQRPWAVRTFLILPPVGALLLTPWLTMLSRGPLAGAVFSVAGPLILYIFAVRTHARGEDAMNFAVAGTLGLAAIGGLLTWRTFLRLEAIDGPRAEIGVPVWLRRGVRGGSIARVRGRHPVWQLAMKELNLQQMTFVVSGLYVISWVATLAARRVIPDFEAVGPTLTAMAFIHGPMVTMLAGALASAEERQFGTLEWQTLQPVAARLQWTVKVGTALGLAVLLAFGLPALLLAITGGPDQLEFGEELAVALIAAVVVFAAALWVSSFSTSGMRALLTAVPILAAGVFALMALGNAAYLSSRGAIRPLARAVHAVLQPDWKSLQLATELIGILMAAGLAVLLLTHAAANHRSADRGRPRISRQAIGIIAYGVFFFLAMAILSFLASEIARLERF